MSYVGGPGYELYGPVEMARHVYLEIQAAGAELGLRDAGYYALDALRIEVGRRAWGAELGPDKTPWEAGLAFAVKLDKACDFIGRDALVAARDQPLRKKLLSFMPLQTHAQQSTWLWGGESIMMDGAPVGELSSAGFSHAHQRCVGLGFVRGEAAQRVHAGTSVVIEVWGEPVPATAWDRLPAA